MKSNPNRNRTQLLVAAAVALANFSAVALDRNWSGGAASYTNAANWTGGVVPGAADVAINNNGTNNAVQINVGNPDWTVGALQAGGAGSGAFLQNGQTVAIQPGLRTIRLGTSAAGTGVYTLNDGTLYYTNGMIAVGEIGTGILNVYGGNLTGNGVLAINAGDSQATANATMDGGFEKTGHTWFAQGFYTPDPSIGLPPEGTTIVAASNATHSFTMAPSYTANNTVIVYSNSTSATITLSAPAAYSALSFMGSAGNTPGGAMVVSYTVFHADASTETGTLSIQDWFPASKTNLVIETRGRVQANGTVTQIIADNPSLLFHDVTLANTTSPVTSIQLNHISGQGITCIAAVSGSSGGDFAPVTFTGYNADMIVEPVAQVDSSITSVLNQTAGNITVNSEMWIGNIGNGVYNLSGGTNTVGNWFAVGRSGGDGVVNMSGGVLNKVGGGNFFIGTGFQSPIGGTPSGTFNLNGGTINCSSGEFLIPENSPATGTLNVSGTGVLNVNNWLAIGRNGGAGTLNLTNGLINKTGGGNIVIGAGGQGEVNQYGGTISNTTSQTWLGEASFATWNMNGGSAVLGLLRIAEGGGIQSFMNLNGGVLTVSEISANISSLSELNLNGGTIRASGDNPNLIHDLTTMNLGAGGVTIDSQGYDISFTQNLTDNGGDVTKAGSGTLTLTAANSYSGATIVNAGTVAVATDFAAGSVGGYAVANGAKLAIKVLSDEAQLNTASATFAAGATLQLDLGNFGYPTAAPVNLSGNLAVNGTATINLLNATPQIGQFPLIKYGTKSGAGSFVIGGLPVGVVASIVNNTANNSIDINITSINLPRWDGQAGGNWDVGLTANWINIGNGSPTFYGQGNTVLFDDNAAGTTTANLVTTVTPSSVTFNNSSKSYTLNGSGKISGSTGLTKQGENLTTIANTGGNDYTGATVISGGALSVASLANGGAPSAIGASTASPTNLVLAGGMLSYSGPSVAINRGYSLQGPGGYIETINDLTLSGSVVAASGSSFSKTGPGQLTYKTVGSNFLTGDVTLGYLVSDGSVVFDGSAGGQTNRVQGSLAVAGATANTMIVMTNTTVTSSGNVDVGVAPGSAGTLNVNSNAALTVGSWFTLGDAPNATAIVNLNGGNITVNNGRLFLGSAPGTVTTLNINGGTITKNGDYFAVVNGGQNGTGARTGVVNQVSGTVTSGSEMWVGDAGGVGGNDSHGIYNLSGGSLTVNNWTGIGRDGSRGTFNMTGGTFTKGGGGDMVIGRGGNGTVGTFNMSGGTLNKGNNNPLIVGQDGGFGTFTQSAGSVDSGNEFWVGQGGGGTGIYNLSGGSINVQNWVAVGRGGGNGTVNMTGGTFTKVGGGQFIVGDNSTGLFNQSGNSTLSINNELWIGQAGGGNSVFNLTNGTVSIGSWFAIGREGAQGVLNIYGGSMTKSGGGNISIAHNNNAHGTVNMYGGAFTNTTSETWVGENGGNTAKGTWNMYGGVAVLGVVHLANASDVQGQMTLNGGSLIANEISTGNNSATNRQLDFNGGTLVAGADNANFIHDLSAANVQAGGAIINTAGHVVSIGQALLDGTGGGGLNKTGNGTLNLNGVNTYTGNTVVNAGILGGIGTIAGPVSVASGATLAPGVSIGKLTINNTLGLAAGSTTVMEVSKNGSTNDLVTGATAITYGGTLVIKNLGGVLAVNDTFKLFNAAGYSSSFSSVVSQTPGQNVTWDTSKLTVDGTVKVLTAVAAPVTLTPVVSGGNINLTWPVLGYRLEVQTNSLAVGVNTNWVTVPGSTSVTALSVPIVTGNPTVFYRLVFP